MWLPVYNYLHHWLYLHFQKQHRKLSFHFNGNFSRWICVSRCLLKQRTMELVVTTGAISRAKLQSNRDHQQTNIHFFFYRRDAFPVAQPTVSKHWMENITFHGLAYRKLTWGSSNLSLTTNSSWLPWGKIAVPLISPLMPVPQPLQLLPSVIVFLAYFDFPVITAG